jgi:hypothetical protein
MAPSLPSLTVAGIAENMIGHFFSTYGKECALQDGSQGTGGQSLPVSKQKEGALTFIEHLLFKCQPLC